MPEPEYIRMGVNLPNMMVMAAQDATIKAIPMAFQIALPGLFRIGARARELGDPELIELCERLSIGGPAERDYAADLRAKVEGFHLR